MTMMKIEALPDDLVDELLDKSTASGAYPAPERTSSEDASGTAGEPETDAVETYPCEFCGHCETPNDCAWAHECPKCGAPAGKISTDSYCKTPTGGITALHAERWVV